jgi:site-specific DNA recombinase
MSTTPRCAIYARYSTDRQNESSTAAQVQVCRDYAKKQGWAVADVFIDEAVSGTIAVKNRPAGGRLLPALGNFDYLLINDLSRLARTQDLAPLIRNLRHKGVRVIGVQDGFDSDHRSARMQAGLSGIMSQEYIAMISDRVQASHEMLTAAGKRVGGRPYGYCIQYKFHPTEKDETGRPAIIGSQMVKDPDTAPVVLRAFQLYADGLSPQQIATRFNAQGIPSPGSSWKRVTRRRDKWLATALFSNPKRGLGILCNEIYRGRYLWNRTQRTKNPETDQVKYMPRPQSEWEVRDDPAWRIVSDELWDRVQAQQAQRSRGRGPAISAGIAASKGKRRGGRDPRYCLGSIVVCAVCDANLQGDSRHDFICPSHATEACTNDLRFRRDELHDAIFGLLKAHSFTPRAIEIARKVVEQG